MFNDLFYLNTEDLNDTDTFIWLMATEEPDMVPYHNSYIHLFQKRINRINIFYLWTDAWCSGWG